MIKYLKNIKQTLVTESLNEKKIRQTGKSIS